MVPSYPPATRTSPLRSLVAVKNARALFIGFAGVQLIACAKAAGAKLAAAAVRIIAAARQRHFLAPIPVFRSWMMFCLSMILISFLFIIADSRFNGKLQALTSLFFTFLAFFDSSLLRSHFWPLTDVQPEIRREVTRKGAEIFFVLALEATICAGRPRSSRSLRLTRGSSWIW